MNRSIPWLLVLLLAGCVQPPGTGPTPTPSQPGSPGSISGSFGGRVFDQVLSAWRIGQPDDPQQTLVVYVFDQAVPNPTPVDCGTVGPSTSDHVLCPCHGSVFTISDGVPQNGPATVPLPAYTVAFDGDDLLVDTGSPAQASDRATT